MEKPNRCTLPSCQLGFDIQLEEDWHPHSVTKSEIKKTRKLERLGRLSGSYVRSGLNSMKECYNAHTNRNKK